MLLTSTECRYLLSLIPDTPANEILREKIQFLLEMAEEAEKTIP